MSGTDKGRREKARPGFGARRQGQMPKKSSSHRPPRTKTFSLTRCGPTPFFTNLSAGQRIHHLIYVLFLFSFTYSNISFLFFYFYYAVLLEAIIENRVTITAVKINNRSTKCTHVSWSPVPLPSLLSVPTALPFPECRRENGVIQSP